MVLLNPGRAEVGWVHQPCEHSLALHLRQHRKDSEREVAYRTYVRYGVGMDGSTAFYGASVAAEVGSLPYVDQVARLRELEAAHRRLEAELSLTVVALAESAGFKADGHSSVRALLRAELRWSEGEVTHRLRTGRLLADFPDVVDALGNGEVGVAQVRDLARVRANPLRQ